MKFNNVLSKVIAVSVLVYSLAGCSASEFFKKSDGSETENYSVEDPFRPDVNQLVSSGNYSLIGEDDEKLFETVLSDENLSNGAALYSSDGEMLSPMNDDGMFGDRIAGDGIYSCLYNVRSDDGKERAYYTQSGNFRTEPVTIKYFDEITSEDLENVNKVNGQLADALSGYYDENGFVKDADAAYRTAVDFTEKLYRSGEVVDYMTDDSTGSVWMKMSSGISYVYNNIAEGTDGGGDDVNIQIKTFQPFREHYLTHRDPSVYTEYMKYPDQGAQKIADEFDCAQFSSSDNYDNTSVDLSNIISNFTSDSIILWHGHGGFDPKYGSHIGTGISLTSFRNSVGASVCSQMIDDQYITRFGVEGETRVGLTYRYFDANLGDMTNSFVYLGTCFSMKDTRLCTVFLNKGASAVIGNDESISSLFNLSMIKSFSEGLTQKNKILWLIPSGYKNAKEALEYAYSNVGGPEAFDSLGKPVLIGDISYRVKDASENAEEQDPSVTSLTVTKKLKLSESYVSVASGSSVTLNVSSVPEGYSASDLVWSSENKKIAKVSNGTVTGAGSGSTVIHVSTSDNKFSAFCAVTVTE